MRTPFSLPALLIVILIAASCRTVQKSQSSEIHRRDSTAKEKIDSGNVSRVDSLTESDTELLFKRERTDSSSSGVVVTLNPSDTTGRIIVEIEDEPIKPEDYLSPEPSKKKKRFSVEVPPGTKSVEIYTKDHKEQKDSLHLHDKDSSALHRSDSGHISRENEIQVSEEDIKKSRTVSKQGLTCGGGILITLFIVGVAAYIYRRWRRRRLTK